MNEYSHLYVAEQLWGQFQLQTDNKTTEQQEGQRQQRVHVDHHQNWSNINLLNNCWMISRETLKNICLQVDLIICSLL